MGDVDQLISELFPDERKKQGKANGSPAMPPPVPASQSNWDADSSDEEPSASLKKIKTPPPNSADRVVPPGVRRGSVPVRRVMDFDDESDEEMAGSGSYHHHAGFTVPFPSHPAHSVLTCQSRCFVTNEGAALRHPHPPLAELRLIAQGKRPCPSETESMWRKGAFYVSDPKCGNGALDFNQADGIKAEGGCTNILCLKCNYMVVRLQGAAWHDEDGAIDLYLTTRNFYPDWSRLANSTAVGAADDKTTSYVLVTDTKAAAYCCQCSWLTVRCGKACIETRLTDAALYRTHSATHPFATELPLKTGETRRPPLWLCKGHTI